MLVVLIFTTSVHAENSDPLKDAWLLPKSLKIKKLDKPDEVQYKYYDFIWKSFIALNWPNVPIKVQNGNIVEGFRGQPDRILNKNTKEKTSILEQTGSSPLKMSVWETYKTPGEVFLKPNDWAKYPAWNTPRSQPVDSHVASKFPGGFIEFATAINQPYFYPESTGPLVDQNGNFVRYQVGINQAFFTYIKHFRYYNADKQIADVAVSLKHLKKILKNPQDISLGFRRPPNGTIKELTGDGYLSGLPSFAKQGLVDVKAAWRVLEENDKPERYLHRTLIVDENGTTKLMGLVALHILRYIVIDEGNGKLIPGYVAATFEQIDNVKGSEDGTIKPSFNNNEQPSIVQKELGFDYSIPPTAQITNPAPQKPVSIYRVTEIPEKVAEINDKYHQILKPSVFQYYQLIGTQNKHPGPVSFKVSERKLNGHEGPITGIYTNTNNLINTALESYSQNNFSCIYCHVRARPQGVPKQAFEIDYFKTLTFLLQEAKHSAE
jgi:hypothetical protein